MKYAKMKYATMKYNAIYGTGNLWHRQFMARNNEI